MLHRSSLPALCYCVLICLALVGAYPAEAVVTNIFSTQFESLEGYSTASNLVGQGFWLGSGSGGNGIVNEFIVGEGQQAYVGFDPPDPADDQLVVWRPITLSPVPTNMTVIQFSVLVCVVDSTTNSPYYDDFYFSVYNTQAHRLFTLDFDNNDLSINYLLDGATNFVATGKHYANDDVYTLDVRMDLAANLWSATLEGVLLATNQPITTTSAALDLGDIAAGWLVYDPAHPGDNFLLFDNYQVTAEVLLPPPPQLQILGRTTDGQVLLRVLGQSNTRFSIDATTNFTQWTALKTNLVTDGSFDHVDSSAAGQTHRFYRARWVP